MRDKDLVIRECEQVLNQNQDIEYALDFLRKNGFDKIESMIALEKILGISAAQAKKLVHFSKTWEDFRDQDTKFHDSLEKEVDKLRKKGQL
jgi:hypothetical protein